MLGCCDPHRSQLTRHLGTATAAVQHYGDSHMKDGESAKIPSHEWLRRNKSYVPSDDIIIPADAKQGFSAGLYRFIENGAHGFWQPPDYEDGHCDPEKFSTRIADRYSELISLTDGPEEHLRLFGSNTDCLFFYICPQAKVAGYSVDFLVYFKDGANFRGVAIECDGHDFHEKTKEQASRDKARGRAILAAGFPVVRFTGSDIYTRTLECVEEIQSLLDGILEGMRKGGRA